MAKYNTRKRKLRLPLILAALLMFCVLGYAGARWVAWPRVKAWREKRTNEVARDKLNQGDLPGAMTAVLTSLRYNQQNVDSWRLAAEIAARQKSHEQVFYTQRIAILEPTLENRLKFLRTAIEFNAYPQAQDMITKVGAEGANSADFLEIAAKVSRRMGNPTRAKYFLMSLVALQPENNEARFELAQLRLREGFAENRPAIRSEIRGLANDPALRTRALAVLLSDAIQAKDAAETLEIADQLVASEGVSPPQQILALEAYHRFSPARFAEYRGELQKAFETDSDRVVLLAIYLNNVGESAEVRRWIDTLPEKMLEAEPVQMSYAAALLSLKDWNALEEYLRTRKWTDTEYVRHAMLAYKHRVNGNRLGFSEAWKLALIEVGSNQRRVQALLSQVIAWGWQEERYELLWKRFSAEPANDTIRQQLIAWERSRGNTAGLNRIFGRIMELDPRDINSKNNYAYTSLLLGTNLDRAYELARQTHAAEPTNPYVLTTQSLALYKQGKPEEALRMIETLGIAALSQPERTLLHALYLVESGRVEDGSNLIANVRPEMFALPEERRLLTDAGAAVARSQREQGNIERLAAISAMGTNQDPDRKSWLALLPAPIRASATVPMELSDSLYAADDFNGLESALKTDRWNELDFLRSALLAFAQRNLQKDGDARTSWRTAIASAGSNGTYLNTLAAMCERWNWPQERMEILARIYQRDPLDLTAFNELARYYAAAGQTTELARIYEQRIEANPNDVDAKSRLAYYSLITNSNLSRAHVLAKEAYDAAPENALRAKVYGYSLLKQNRPLDSWRVLESLPTQRESGEAQLSLIKAASAAQRKDLQQTRAFLDSFDAGSALPEEQALAESITKDLGKDA